MLGNINGHDPRIKYSPGVKCSYMLYKINYFNLRATFEIGILEPAYASDAPL